MDDYLNIYWGHDVSDLLSQSIWEDKAFNQIWPRSILPTFHKQVLAQMQLQICTNVYVNTHTGCPKKWRSECCWNHGTQ